MTDSIARFAFVFPGQGSQSVGMMAALAAEFACVRQRFDSASGVLGFDLWQLVEAGPESALNSTQNTQPALLAASVATWDAWLESGGRRPQMMAGHSFGEYTALVCAGALDYASAVALVADRGRFMQQAVPAGEGAMAAVLGLGVDELSDICARVSAAGGLCSCANLNAPGQIVIAGTRDAVQQACELATAGGARRVMILPVSVPAHCALMRPAAEQFGQRLATVDMGVPAIPVVHNVDVCVHQSAEAIRAALVHQLESPVRWTETIEHFAASGIEQIYECGPGKVLSALIKRIDRKLQCQALSDPQSIREAVAHRTEDLS